ncbi:dinucleotide-utilizing enzyme possibly involved in molybdopterin or thiamin biosynthesis [Rivularia sp. PCC 7116]|uniref:HesA/MoeB/ThiF family protein n=1 Tax=Rivularia sp. PCC 7116 TaxID=373994 RepID=UPI00029F29FE|nr:ThiF family adenylyltransferase [Rivularia sp. PCC 7116]AFY57355.1 dinucleotide-utilizing enzyme possibly involved in molybdopterin or thiamin biosynthesis [Rivularia sp. PCC 7116]
MNTKFSLHIPPKMWSDFQKSMLSSRMFNEEVIGFLFCQRHQVSKRKVRYIPKTWVVPTSECYEHQSTDGLVLTQRFHSYLLENHLFPGLDIVHIHTHAGVGIPEFSYVDNRYESEYAKFIASHFPEKPRLVSGVFDEGLDNCKFRIWDRKGREFQQVDFCNSLFEISDSENIFDNPNLMFARQKTFGETNQKTLNQLKVGLIGCGGIGSIFAELLGRLGVKNWVLVDPDKLEQVNLNRMTGATQEMVEHGWYKVHYVKHLIKKIYACGSHVKTISTAIEAETATQEIANCDLIVVATDNHLSRKTAQEVALKYMRPLVCLGTHIDVKPDGTPRMYCRITVPPLGGDWCLMCGNIINLQRAALESAPSEINHMAENAGYLEGVNDPSVFWLNSICASTAVGVIHGIVSGFMNVDSGIDWIYEFPGSEWRKTDTTYLQTDDCYFCGLNSSENLVQESDYESPDFEEQDFDNSDFIVW